MKKNKTKTPAKIVPKTPEKNNIPPPLLPQDLVGNLFGDTKMTPREKMTPEKQEKFKQKTLEILRDYIRKMASEPSANKSEPKEESLLESIKQKPLNEKEVELLRARSAEYLKNFVIFGYDMRGQRVLITSCHTMEDKDAVLQMSQQIPFVLMQMFSGKAPDDSSF